MTFLAIGENCKTARNDPTHPTRLSPTVGICGLVLSRRIHPTLRARLPRQVLLYDNQVLYSFKLRTSPLETWTWFEATDQGRTYRLLMGKGETDHYYLNLPVRARPAIQCSVDHSVEELSGPDLTKIIFDRDGRL